MCVHTDASVCDQTLHTLTVISSVSTYTHTYKDTYIENSIYVYFIDKTEVAVYWTITLSNSWGDKNNVDYVRPPGFIAVLSHCPNSLRSSGFGGMLCALVLSDSTSGCFGFKGKCCCVVRHCRMAWSCMENKNNAQFILLHGEWKTAYETLFLKCGNNSSDGSRISCCCCCPQLRMPHHC